MDNETQSSPAAGNVDAPREVVEGIEGQAKLLSVRDIYKSFGANAVLKGISLEVDHGEVLALIGGNGAGKSTLMKIIMGIYSADSGDVIIGGDKVDISNPKAALAHSIYMVPQEPMLFPNMTVRENITIGFEEKATVLNERLENVMNRTGWHMDLERKAMTLSIAEQGIVEVLRGLMRNPEVLILDEPTSALTFDEVQSLFNCVRELQKQNIGIIYITHRLAEVFELATNVAILRDGIVAMQGKVSDFTREDLVRGLLPPDASSICVDAASSARAIDYDASPILELKDFSGYGFKDINLKVYPGEIVGMAGVIGAGRTEMATTIFGREKPLGGKVLLDGKDITGKSTADIINAGINYVPEDRFTDALFRIRDVSENTTSSLLCGKRMGGFLLNFKKEEETSQRYVNSFRTKVTGLDQEVGGLSGGNQQKIVIGRTFASVPRLVILDEPTRGIDAAARGDVYAVLNQLRETGVSILLISSDMEEVVELADRAVVMFQGRINSEFKKADIKQDNLMSAAFGVVKDKGAVPACA
ncbi:sugar ABC transporter ATP-binding protein [Olsenella sp. Marseille-P4559]|uniref:sugar ABC transporter ATP-binding protein n=1 Tax=Olsenella sp. Marseille-P4559 TaxID=2364795 RepID=UPI0010322DAF|nr:sugar ABC transporter ATP-binding protein [Olsenella sp. Marseille-P4559]